MYTILNNGIAVIRCDTLETAINMVRSLESSIDRSTSHSPYTIQPTEQVRDQADASISKADLHAKAIWPPVPGPRNWPCPS